MTASQQLPIISFGSKGNRGRYGLATPPPAEHVSFNPEMVGIRYGWVEIISSEKRWKRNWRDPMVLTRCASCGRVQWTDYYNLVSGKSAGCQPCSQPRQVPLWLDRRLTAAKQRCENPSNPGYHNFGARGIKFKFASVTEAGIWIIQNLGLPGRYLEIDRINNEGHYEAENLRWATRVSRCGNRRITVLKEWNPHEWPYARSTVVRKLSSGMTREQIIEEARSAVYEKRKNWRGIAAKLASMTF